MAERLFIVGATGKVGRELISQIQRHGDMDPRHINPTRIVGLASRTGYAYNFDGLGETDIAGFVKRRSETKHNGIPDLLNKIGDDRGTLRVVDVTASEEMLAIHTTIIRSTRHSVVTANKLPLVNSSYREFQEMTSNPGRYGYRCSVMAGADVVPFLRDLRDLGERPSEIAGCFSGTLGHIAYGLESGKAFSEVLKDAVSRGYTEPNPAVDLSGSDVAAKLLILARSAGFNVDKQDIKPVPFVPLEYISEPNAEALMERVREVDEPMAREMAKAKAEGQTLRYVARLAYSAGMPTMDVGPTYLPMADPLGQLKGTANKVTIKTGPYQRIPTSYEAPGAGVDVTARNIRRDLLTQIRDRETC